MDVNPHGTEVSSTHFMLLEKGTCTIGFPSLHAQILLNAKDSSNEQKDSTKQWTCEQTPCIRALGREFQLYASFHTKTSWGREGDEKDTVVFRWVTVQMSLIGLDNIVPTSASVVGGLQFFSTPATKSNILA